MCLRTPETCALRRAIQIGFRYLFCTMAMLAFGSAALASTSDGSSRFVRLRESDARVAGVTYRLAISNRQWCRGTLASQPGFVLHDLAQYGSADREAAARIYGLGAGIGVMAVVDGSPAARAGLRVGDQLDSVNGTALPTDAHAALATGAFVDRARRIIAEEMRKGELIVRVSSGGSARDIRFATESGCPADVQLVPAAGVNAWADGEHVMVTDAIVAQCPTDNDLALLIAHELAHNLLHHRRRLALAGISDGISPPVSAVALAMVRETEEEADRSAVRMASAAGYDLTGSASFLGGLLDANGLRGPTAATHPQARRRLALLQAAVAMTRVSVSGGL